MIEKNIITNILVEISELSNDFILTGSCSDMFNIGYVDIEDIDLIINENSFNKINKLLIKKFNLNYSLRHKKDGHLLNRYVYNTIQVDILIKQLSQIDCNTINIKLNETNTIKNCDLKTRYNQLLNHNYKHSSPKIKKVETRLILYEKLFFQTQETDLDKPILLV